MRHQELNEPVLERIKALKAGHPFWGYRRIWAYLKYREGLDVNKKRIYRFDEGKQSSCQQEHPAEGL